MVASKQNYSHFEKNQKNIIMLDRDLVFFGGTGFVVKMMKTFAKNIQTIGFRPRITIQNGRL